MRYLSTVYVRQHRARVQCRRGSLLVSSPEGSQRIPIEAIDALVVLGGAQITMQAIDACVNRGVRVAALKRGGAVRFTVTAPTGGNIHLRSALFQAAMDPSRSLDLSKAIVAAKLQNSGIVVSRWSRDEKNPEKSDSLAERSEMIRARIARLAEAETGDHVRGIEGDAARIYFRAVGEVLASSPLPFTARTRRPPRDPVNAMLGFCYGLLVTECVGAVESMGLDHQIGLLPSPALRPPFPCPRSDRRVSCLNRPVCGVTGAATTTEPGQLRANTRGRRVPERRWSDATADRMGRAQGSRDPASPPGSASGSVGAAIGSGHIACTPFTG